MEYTRDQFSIIVTNKHILLVIFHDLGLVKSLPKLDLRKRGITNEHVEG